MTKPILLGYLDGIICSFLQIVHVYIRNIVPIPTPFHLSFPLPGISGDVEWQWVDCEESGSWQETLWAPGRPAPDADPGCGVLGSDGFLRDAPCDRKHHFVCEIFPKGNNTKCIIDFNERELEAYRGYLCLNLTPK